MEKNNESTPAESASKEEDSSEESDTNNDPTGLTIVSEILEVAPGDIQSFAFYSNPTLLMTKGGAVKADGIADYVCYDLGTPYHKEQLAFLSKVADALNDCDVQAESEVLNTSMDIPEEECFSMVLMSGEANRAQYLAFFPSGEIQVHYGTGKENDDKRWFLTDPSQYQVLKDLLTEIQVELENFPLDYQLRHSISPDTFNPKSTAVKFTLVNKGKKTIEVTSLKLEKLVDKNWELFAEGSFTDVEYGPGESRPFGIHLDKVEGA